MSGPGKFTLSSASPFTAMQRAFNEQLREWYWQRAGGSFYHIWEPPGVVFCNLKKDHYAHGRWAPPWEKWGFTDNGRRQRRHLILGTLGGRWAVSQAKSHEQDQWIAVDSDDSRVFHTFLRSAKAFGGFDDPSAPDRSFPNLRLFCANERFAPKFLAASSCRSVHIHLPHSGRETRPARLPLITQEFVSDVSDILEEDGEVHIVADENEIIQSACGVLTQSRLFQARFPFPFHQEGVPAAYPAVDLLHTGASESREDRRSGPLRYTCWQKSVPRLPNARFNGGKGYGQAAQNLLVPSGKFLTMKEFKRLSPHKRRDHRSEGQRAHRRRALLLGTGGSTE